MGRGVAAFSDAIRVAEAAANRQALDVKDQEEQQEIAVELLKELGLDLVAELEKRDAQKSALVKLKERIWDFGGDAPPKAILIQDVWIRRFCCHGGGDFSSLSQDWCGPS